MATTTEDHCCSTSRRLVAHVFDGIFLLFILVLQGTILNYYIIEHYRSSVHPYFWFLGDIASLFLFAITLTISYQYLSKVNTNYDTNSFFMSPKRILYTHFPTTKFGIMPLSYVSWIFYSAVHLAKVITIFKSGIPDNLNPGDILGSHILQITMALSGVIFLLLAEGHNWSSRQSPRYLYVTSVGWKTGIEILDTVNLLALLLVNETKMVLTYALENSILIVCSFNFFLPALALYKLSLSDVKTENLFLPLKVLQNVLHLCLIDIPFLCIRIYIWVAYGRNASIFLMKNIFSIMMVVRSIYPDFEELYRRKIIQQDMKKDGEYKVEGTEDIAMQALNSDSNHLNTNEESRA